MSVLSMSSAPLRLSLCATAALLSACATGEGAGRQAATTLPADGYGRHRASEYAFKDRPLSAQTLADRGAEVVALLKVGHGVNFKTSRMPRTVLAGASGSAAIAMVASHEAAFQSDSEKTENIAGEQSPGPVLIAENAGGWMETEDAYIHEFSGMACAKAEFTLVPVKGDAIGFVAMPIKNIQVFDGAGYDTACHYESQQFGIAMTFYASRWPDVALDDHFNQSVSQILSRLPIETETLSVSAEAEVEEGYDSTIEGKTLSAAFLLERQNNIQYKTALWLNKTGDWHVKARATFAMLGDDEDVAFTEIFAATNHATKLVEIDKHINLNGGGVQVSY